MKVAEIKNAVSTLSGVGPSTSSLFANLNIFTVGDLLQFYPRTWEDRTKRINLSQFNFAPKVHTVAKVIAHDWFGYGTMKTLKIIINDGTMTAELVAFNRPFLEKTFPVDSIISVTGKFDVKYNKLQSTQFEAEKIADTGELSDYEDFILPDSKVFPIYRLTEKLTQKAVRKAVKQALLQYSRAIEDEIPEKYMQKRNLMHKRDALKSLHIPESLEQCYNARKTLIYEEFFKFQTAVIEKALKHKGSVSMLDAARKEISISDDEFEASLSPRQKNFLERLPYSLTSDQKKVIFQANTDIDKSYSKEIQMTSPFSMQALLQGDVGSGKTLVSFFACLRIKDYGSQSAFMAPTEILAKQHAENAASMLEALGVKVAFLTGNVKEKGRLPLLKALKDGEIDLVIGTHALFSKTTEYHDLALVIIDEQHRFGVMQRSAIIDKGRRSSEAKLPEPNLLMMSATPIPQSLALTLYGDLDIFTIRTKPANRLEIQTFLTKAGNEQNAYNAVRKELEKGRQAYFVYPAIEENFDEDGNSTSSKMKSAEEMFKFLAEKVYPDFKVALIHGKIAEEEQNKILTDFKDGKINIIVATTVVEVGVDVPNATCMVIEQAERFGLAALHQLRGRVGRGKFQSYCFLIYSANLTEKGKARLKTLRETTDGFKIAEEDLKLRGPGEITGTVQSGELSFAIGNPVDDSQIMQQARSDAIDFLSNV